MPVRSPASSVKLTATPRNLEAIGRHARQAAGREHFPKEFGLGSLHPGRARRVAHVERNDAIRMQYVSGLVQSSELLRIRRSALRHCGLLPPASGLHVTGSTSLLSGYASESTAALLLIHEAGPRNHEFKGSPQCEPFVFQGCDRFVPGCDVAIPCNAQSRSTKRQVLRSQPDVLRG